MGAASSDTCGAAVYNTTSYNNGTFAAAASTSYSSISFGNGNDTCEAYCTVDEFGECGHPAQTMHAYIVPTIMGIITLIGLVGNAIVVVVICCQGQMKTVTNYYIVNLAITDLAFLIACAPFTASLYATRDWIFGRIMCKFVFFLQQVTAQSTCITLVCLAIDRYRMIMYPLESLYKRTRSQIGFIMLTIWLSSTMLAAPLLIIFDLVEHMECEQNLIFCVENWPQPYANIMWRGYVVYAVLVQYAVPLSVIIACYSMILVRLWKQIPSPNTNDHQHHHIRLERDKRRVVTRMILAVIVAFAVCWLPLHVINLWGRFDPCFSTYQDNPVLTAMMAVAHALIYTNSSINPILYALLGGNFRHHLREMVAGRTARKFSTSSLQTPHARLAGSRTTQV